MLFIYVPPLFPVLGMQGYRPWLCSCPTPPKGAGNAVYPLIGKEAASPVQLDTVFNSSSSGQPTLSCLLVPLLISKFSKVFRQRLSWSHPQSKYHHGILHLIAVPEYIVRDSDVGNHIIRRAGFNGYSVLPHLPHCHNCRSQPLPHWPP